MSKKQHTTLILEIDFRERGTIELLKKRTNLDEVKTDTIYTHAIASANIISFMVTNMPVGDFIVREMSKTQQTNTNEETTTTNANNDIPSKLHFIFERKTISDLCSSITDGRFRQQKERLMNSVDSPNKIVFIIEGTKSNGKKTSLPKNVIDGAITNLIFKHNHKVLTTCDESDTLDNLLLLYKKIANGDIDISNHHQIEPVSQVLVKKSESINQNLFATQLSVIPGVSFKTALTIAQSYPSAHALIQALSENSNLTLLSNIPISPKRTLGKALSVKIYNALFGGGVQRTE